MKILLIGGTVFLGRHLVEIALQHGHSVTLFNRNQSNPQLFPQVEKLVGDRRVDLNPLAGRIWDALIDTCGYLPQPVRLSSEFLRGAVGQAVFVSTLSVYADTKLPGQDEHAPLAVLGEAPKDTLTPETYGPLKALCEEAFQESFGKRALVIRPGLIVGPHDPSDRFTYWPYRVAQGGEVLAPGRPTRPVQWIDVRDLAEWILHLLESGQTGIFNATGPQAMPTSMEDLLIACRSVSESIAHFTWVDETFLVAQNVSPWIEMPLWIPETDPENAGFFAFSNQKALQAGLALRPIVETVHASLDWIRHLPSEHQWRAGISRQREMELLTAWRESRLGKTPDS